jgi:hypothetical protein
MMLEPGKDDRMFIVTDGALLVPAYGLRNMLTDNVSRRYGEILTQ